MDVHPINVFDPRSSANEGNSIFFNPVQSLNTQSPNDSTFSPILNSPIAEQSEKADEPICFTPSGRTNIPAAVFVISPYAAELSRLIPLNR